MQENNLPSSFGLKPEKSLKEIFQRLFLFLIVLTFSTSALAQNEICEILKPWFAIKEKIQESKKVLERSDLLMQEIQERKNISVQLFHQYIGGNFKFADFLKCLAGQPDRQNFLNTVHANFFEQSLQKLRNSAAPQIQNLMGVLDQKWNGQIVLFRMVNNFDSAADNVFNAGFYRDRRSIFMNTDRISGNEWMTIFIHEISHAIDGALWESIAVYNQTEWIKEFAEWSQKTSNEKDLPAETQARLQKWLQSGFDRGLWAEYRAWFITLKLYQAGLQDGLWNSIPWVEEMLNDRAANETFGEALYRRLDQKFTSPQRGIFLSPLMQNAVRNFRNNYGPGKKLPSLGNLQTILD